MNPSLLIDRDVVHVQRNISLTWLRDILLPFEISVSTYMTLRCALLNEFGVYDIPSTYMELDGIRTIQFAPVLAPLWALAMSRRAGEAIRVYALRDAVVLLEYDSQAWRQIISVSGWNVLVTNLYIAVQAATDERKTKAEGNTHSANDRNDAITTSTSTSFSVPHVVNDKCK